VSSTYPLRVYSFSDYDISDWTWDCGGCNKHVAQKQEWNVKVLKCWRCDYALKVHKHTLIENCPDKPEAHRYDAPYEFIVELVNAPTKADLLLNRDRGVEERWAKVQKEVKATKDLWKSQPTPNQDELNLLRSHAENMKTALKELQRVIDHYENYKAEWAKRELE